MAKILLVEDDENLREIYQARLVAEGYDIVSAKDGEEALVAAKQEKPDLIIADIMMPRISGFEMLDILRNTEGMKHVRVIMLTALGQAEDKQRADKLGADRYLVKSQVTLEDIVHAAAELLGDQAAKPTPEPTAPPAMQTPPPSQPSATTPTTTPVTPIPAQAAGSIQQPPSLNAAPTPLAQPSPTNATPVPMPQPAPQLASPVPQPTPIQSTPRSVPNFRTNAAARPVSARSSTPSAPPIAQPPSSVPQRQANTSSTPPAPSQPPSGQSVPTSPKEINNASQLADAVNNLINGTSSQPTSIPQHGSVPTSGSDPSQQIRPIQPTAQASAPQQIASPQQAPSQIPATPRAFPTGAPTVAPEPPKSVSPAVQAPQTPKPYPEPNVTKPQTQNPPTPQPQSQPNETPDSIAIKDKKTVSPLMTHGGVANTDLNDLLKKEDDGQDEMSQLNSQHQPGQVFTPGGSTTTEDPGKISL